MGRKKIEAKRKEFLTTLESYRAFVKAAEEFDKKKEEIKKAHDSFVAMKEKLAKSVAVIDTHGVPEFEAFKSSLVAVCSNQTFQDRPLPLKPVQLAAKRLEQEMADLEQQWLDKQVAAWPKEVKPGMLFKSYNVDTIYEVKAQVEVKNPNLTGDAAIWFKVEGVSGKNLGKTVELSLKDMSPKNKWKYVNLG